MEFKGRVTANTPRRRRPAHTSPIKRRVANRRRSWLTPFENAKTMGRRTRRIQPSRHLPWAPTRPVFNMHTRRRSHKPARIHHHRAINSSYRRSPRIRNLEGRQGAQSLTDHRLCRRVLAFQGAYAHTLAQQLYWRRSRSLQQRSTTHQNHFCLNWPSTALRERLWITGPVMLARWIPPGLCRLQWPLPCPSEEIHWANRRQHRQCRLLRGRRSKLAALRRLLPPHCRSMATMTPRRRLLP